MILLTYSVFDLFKHVIDPFSEILICSGAGVDILMSIVYQSQIDNQRGKEMCRKKLCVRAATISKGVCGPLSNAIVKYLKQKK